MRFHWTNFFHSLRGDDVQCHLLRFVPYTRNIKLENQLKLLDKVSELATISVLLFSLKIL